MKTKLLIYGSNGYTGALTAHTAAKQGMQPILAGRHRRAVEALAVELSMEARIFSLNDPAAIEAALNDVAVVLHCAGPFIDTYLPMLQACIKTGTHYLDITGEIEVFRGIHTFDSQARAAGVMLMPGVGFDVVPSDCLAAHLKRRLPSATKLNLAFLGHGPARFSRGTARTSIQNLGQPAYIRRGGELTPVAHLSKSRLIDFGRGPKPAERVKWGDVFTAYYTTGIPNIENYIASGGGIIWLLRLARYYTWLLRSPLLKAFLKPLTRLLPPGPNREQIQRSGSVFWGEAKDDEGKTVVARITAPEGYYLTALASLAVAQKALSGDTSPGFQTPGGAYGPDWVLDIEGISRVDVV